MKYGYDRHEKHERHYSDDGDDKQKIPSVHRFSLGTKAI